MGRRRRCFPYTNICCCHHIGQPFHRFFLSSTHLFLVGNDSPFFNIGTGYIHIQPQTTIVQAQDLNDEIVHAGLGADLYLSRKFMVRMEYRRHTVLTSRDDNEELNQWKAGFSIFF